MEGRRATEENVCALLQYRADGRITAVQKANHLPALPRTQRSGSSGAVSATSRTMRSSARCSTAALSRRLFSIWRGQGVRQRSRGKCLAVDYGTLFCCNILS